jgi:hypothetical protein
MNPKLQSFILAEMKLWARFFIMRRRKFLEAKRLKDTGTLINSFDSETQARGEAIQCLLAFEDYGRYLDMKTTRPTQFGQAYVDALKEWMEGRAWKQEAIDAYVHWRGLRKVPTDVLNSIAWGIAISQKGKRKQRSWYLKPQKKAVEDLFDRLVVGLPSVAIDEITSVVLEQDEIGGTTRVIYRNANNRFYINDAGKQVNL